MDLFLFLFNLIKLIIRLKEICYVQFAGFPLFINTFLKIEKKM